MAPVIFINDLLFYLSIYLSIYLIKNIIILF